ncbi:component of SufBCD complex [Tropicimonas sp. S265A]|uniref:component of SufBCD complex n=1 Tax=Tropicimonas sp. S265A TaxID=3415134 RepID=UPI003C7A6EC6
MSARQTRPDVLVDLTIAATEIIDMRSFSSMWFWITLAVFWSAMSHYAVGVPYDMVQRAFRRNDEQAWRDLEALARINARRLLVIGSSAGVFVAGFAGFLLTTLLVLGFFYRVEFFQAAFMIAFPFALVGLLSQRTARLILEVQPEGPDLARGLRRHRFYVQLIGMVSILVTAFWGVFHVLSTGVLGN